MRPRKAITQYHLDDAGTVDHRYGHWVAVAAVCLLAIALVRTLSRARAPGGSAGP